MITGHITDISPIRDDFVYAGGVGGIKAVEITVKIAIAELQNLDLSRSITITQEENQ